MVSSANNLADESEKLKEESIVYIKNWNILRGNNGGRLLKLN